MVKIKVNKRDLETLKGIDLAELCITSSVELIDSKVEKIVIETFKAEGNKCPVCWKIRVGTCLRNGKKCLISEN